MSNSFNIRLVLWQQQISILHCFLNFLKIKNNQYSYLMQCIRLQLFIQLYYTHIVNYYNVIHTSYTCVTINYYSNTTYLQWQLWQFTCYRAAVLLLLNKFVVQQHNSCISAHKNGIQLNYIYIKNRLIYLLFGRIRLKKKTVKFFRRIDTVQFFRSVNTAFIDIRRQHQYILRILRRLHAQYNYDKLNIYVLINLYKCLFVFKTKTQPRIIQTLQIQRSLSFFNFYLGTIQKCTYMHNYAISNIITDNRSLFSFITGNYFLLLFLDLEYLTGLSLCIQLNYIRHIIFSTRLRIFRAFFTCVRRVWWRRWHVNIFNAFDAVALSLITKDVDSLLTFFCSIFQGIHFSNVSRVLSAYANIIQALWIYARDCLYFSGIKVLFRGKLGWRLLTRKKTFKLMLGCVGSNSQYYNCIYRYNTVSTDTGVFGLSIYYFYTPRHVIINKDELKKLNNNIVCNILL